VLDISEEIETVFEADDTRLVLVEGQSSRLQPPGQPLFDLTGLVLVGAQCDQVVSVADHDRGSRHGFPGGLVAFGDVPGSGGPLQTV
jgi:uncharacterized NAD-dependent epimerase/dehydratase family protein